MYNDVCNEWFKISFKDIYSAIGVTNSVETAFA